ncbi:CidA/LrgA family protein [Rhodovulum kholense]|uniref:Holin-like protein n=1 Tax=Rhodovulum kholense TaxID=453584 RepID=A0A8E2VJ23_9RHOB|nr:CidA/LrgA family protein [Rhodovulum kholense]PTW47703.1 holin-like protein [Rhodovulum kholense]
MTAHALARQLRIALRRSRLVQIGLLVGFWLAGEAVVRLTGLPLPGGLVGMAAALALLGSGLVRAGTLRRGANWFLAEMLLFFVPAVLAVLNHREFLGLLGLQILLIIVLGTLAVMAVTALTVELCCRWGIGGHGQPSALD